ncbi:hypothetical protein E2C01_075823 [Portunus trituberculatus]|uniref:Uncharacterized protein n=1 Tax=Portunus trituberculatus TaxID=210409 RepID=A0A5B7IGS3_PORTR|nr:hypothetical protein [Portunus trituberculatus]
MTPTESRETERGGAAQDFFIPPSLTHLHPPSPAPPRHPSSPCQIGEGEYSDTDLESKAQPTREGERIEAAGGAAAEEVRAVIIGSARLSVTKFVGLTCLKEVAAPICLAALSKGQPVQVGLI